MRRCALSAVVLACSLLAGCFVTSLNPLFESTDYVYDKALVGIWNSEGGQQKETLAIASAGENTYRIMYSGSEARETYEAHLGQISGARYLDIFPVTENTRAGSHYIPVHSFWRVRVSGDTLYLTQMDYQWLKQFLDASSAALAHQENGDTLVLTATSDDLRSFIRLHADELFQKDFQGVWKRQ